MTALPLNYTDMLSQLVAKPSVSSQNTKLDNSNEAIINQLAEWLETLKFSIDVLPVPSETGNKKFNLIATLGSGTGGLVLAGHTDTVPFDEGRWQTDPFTLTEKDNALYGLGSTDMKGFFPAAIEAAKAFTDQPLKHPLIILATADEETSMAGARALANADTLNARYAIIGEPTGLKPIRMHKGVMMESITLEGQSGHSSNPDLGVNALDAMYKVIGELMSLRQSWHQHYANPGFDIAFPTMNLAAIRGGDATNRICSHCSMDFDVRLVPGMQSSEVRANIQERLARVLEQTGVRFSMHSLFEGVEAFDQTNNDFVKTVEKLTHHCSEAVNFATEAPFLQSMGMQTLVLGPGDINCAHQPNEYIALNQIDPAINLLKSLIRSYCL